MFSFINDLDLKSFSALPLMNSRDAHTLGSCGCVRVCSHRAVCGCQSIESQRTYAGQPASLPTVSSFSLFLPVGWPLLGAPSGHATTHVRTNPKWQKKRKNRKKKKCFSEHTHTRKQALLHPSIQHSLRGLGEWAPAPAQQQQQPCASALATLAAWREGGWLGSQTASS